MKVSFILPAYKRRFLKEAIDSILAQTCRDFELVIVDDKSPEELYEVIREYPWEPEFETLPDGGRKWIVDGISVRYYQNKENIGGRDLVAAWEKALTYASNDWCVLASDDDIYKPGYLREMVRLINKYPDVNLCHCRTITVDLDGRFFNVQCERREYESGIRFWRNTFMYHKQAAPEFVFRKSALKRVGGFVKFPCAWGTDDATWSSIATIGGAVCSEEVLYVFRRSGLNITASEKYNYQKMIASIRLIDWAEEFVKQLTPQTQEDQAMILDTMQLLRSNKFYPVAAVISDCGIHGLVKMFVDCDVPRTYKNYALKCFIVQLVNPGYWYAKIKKATRQFRAMIDCN